MSRSGVTGDRGQRTQSAPYFVPAQQARHTHLPPPPPTDNQVVANLPLASNQTANLPPPDAANFAAECQVSDLSIVECLQTIHNIVHEEQAATPSITQDNTHNCDTSDNGHHNLIVISHCYLTGLFVLQVMIMLKMQFSSQYYGSPERPSIFYLPFSTLLKMGENGRAQ